DSAMLDKHLLLIGAWRYIDAVAAGPRGCISVLNGRPGCARARPVVGIAAVCCDVEVPKAGVEGLVKKRLAGSGNFRSSWRVVGCAGLHRGAARRIRSAIAAVARPSPGTSPAYSCGAASSAETRCRCGCTGDTVRRATSSIDGCRSNLQRRAARRIRSAIAAVARPSPGTSPAYSCGCASSAETRCRCGCNGDTIRRATNPIEACRNEWRRTERRAEAGVAAPPPWPSSTQCRRSASAAKTVGRRNIGGDSVRRPALAVIIPPRSRVRRCTKKEETKCSTRNYFNHSHTLSVKAQLLPKPHTMGSGPLELGPIEYRQSI